jgi:hypothetical protein
MCAYEVHSVREARTSCTVRVLYAYSNTNALAFTLCVRASLLPQHYERSLWQTVAAA